MKTISIQLFFIFVMMSIQSNAQIKIDRQRFVTLFNQGKHVQVFQEAYDLRNKKEYGKKWDLDYFMARALCAMKDFENARKGFAYILHEYPLNKEQRDFINNEKSLCDPASKIYSQQKLFALMIANWVGDQSTPVAMSRGKLGFVLNCKTDPDAYRFDPSFDQAELEKRLFEKNESEKAIKYYQQILGNDYNISASGRFVFITPSLNEFREEQRSEVVVKLERVYQFYSGFYGIRPPDKLITVYLMGNKSKLREVALKVHGLNIPHSNLGYSCLADLSVLGNSDETSIGTIYHELFHLMIRTDIGDIPGWLDEGFACLYEESGSEKSWKGDTLKGISRPWRTIVLKLNSQARNPLPTLRKIMMNNWSEFSPNEATTVCQVANNYALVRHFAIFMQEKGWLQNVVTAFKNRKNVFVDTTYQNESPVKIFEQAIQVNLDDVQKEFDMWLYSNYSIRVKREKSDVIDRLDEMCDALNHEYRCREKPEYNDFKKECSEIYDKLKSIQGNKIPEDLLERTATFISKVEELLAQCGHF